ncbi:MAG: XdhC family protein [Nitrososphaeria archaeon]|jgi:xanthine dehydrogenase accessory factor
MSAREMAAIAEKMNELSKRGEGYVLVFVVSYKGHSARHEGAAMLVTRDGKVFGTVGGGALEKFAVDKALEFLSKGQGGLVDIPATSELGSACGGAVTLYFKVVNPSDVLVIFGAGHVGQALSRMASQLGFRIVVADDRPEYATKERFPEASEIIIAKPKEAVERIPKGQNVYVAVMYYSADLELEILKELLRHDFKYIGVIASPVKTLKYLNELYGMYPEEKLLKIRAPMGLDIGGGEEPSDISLSILAEIQSVRYGTTPRPLTKVPELLQQLKKKAEIVK